MTELRCDANEGLELITRSFWVDRDSTVAKAVWMGLDDQEGPRISTTAKDGADGDKDVSADAEAKVVDTVAYEGLKAGEEYELSATLVDKATGEPVADDSGVPVEAQAEFAPALSSGSQDVEIAFDASLLGGRDLVAFESLRKDEAEVASHADLSDEGQTVHVAVEVGTQAADAADGDQVIEAGKAKVIDTVAYKGLVPGETYIAVGTLMDKGTGEPFLDKDGNEVTARTPFEPEAPSGTVEVTFEFDTEGLAEGDELVVFEKVLDSAGNVVAAHEDIDSAEQSVVVDNPGTPEVPEEPYAKTGADAPDGTGYAVAAGIALAAAAGAGGALAYRKRKTAGASKDAADEEPEEERRRIDTEPEALGARPGPPLRTGEDMNKGKAATALAIAVALLAMGALAVLPLSERNPYEVHEVPTAEEDATMEAQETGGGIDWDALPASVVAWVRVPGTTVDYPIVQGRPESPDFYLTHDAGGERSAWGAPYIDAGCAQGAESPLVIVYGHHMSDGTMFAPLAQYSSRDFAEGHRTIRVYTREKAIELKVFAADVVDASSEGKRTDFADAAELAAYLGDKLSRCEVVLEEPSDVAQAWAFVTCSYQTSNSRTVVYAKEVEGWDSRPSE